MNSTTTCTVNTFYVAKGGTGTANLDITEQSGATTLGTPAASVSLMPYEEVCVTESDGSGGGGGASYIIDVGSSIMLGGILMFLIAYWFIGLIRKGTSTWNT